MTPIPKKILDNLNNWESSGIPAFQNEASRIKQHLLTCPNCQKEMREDYDHLKNTPKIPQRI